MLKQLRCRQSVPWIPAQSTLQEINEVSIGSPFFDPIFQANSFYNTMFHMPFRMSAHSHMVHLAVLTFLVEKGVGSLAALETLLGRSTNISDH